MQGPGGLPSCTGWQFDFGGIFQKGGEVHTSSGCEPTRLIERDKCIEFRDNLHCISKQCVSPHMSTVITLFTCVNID